MTARSWRLLAADRSRHVAATAQLLVNFIAGRRSFVNNKINVKSCFVGPENINSGASTRGGCRGGQTITVAARVTPAGTERGSDVRRAVTNRPLAVFEKAWNNATDVMVFTCCCFDHDTCCCVSEAVTVRGATCLKRGVCGLKCWSFMGSVSAIRIIFKWTIKART